MNANKCKSEIGITNRAQKFIAVWHVKSQFIWEQKSYKSVNTNDNFVFEKLSSRQLSFLCYYLTKMCLQHLELTCLYEDIQKPFQSIWFVLCAGLWERVTITWNAQNIWRSETRFAIPPSSSQCTFCIPYIKFSFTEHANYYSKVHRFQTMHFIVNILQISRGWRIYRNEELREHYWPLLNVKKVEHSWEAVS